MLDLGTIAQKIGKLIMSSNLLIKIETKDCGSYLNINFYNSLRLNQNFTEWIRNSIQMMHKNTLSLSINIIDRIWNARDDYVFNHKDIHAEESIGITNNHNIFYLSNKAND